MNRLFLFLAVGLLLLSSVSIAYADGEVFDGDTVYVNDSRAYISATPHTIQGSGWVENVIESKQYSGNVNWVMLTTEYSREYFRPTALQYYDDTLETVGYWEDNNTYVEETREIGWTDVPRSFIKNNVQVVGKNRAYAITNIPVVAGEPTRFRYYIKQTYYTPIGEEFAAPDGFVGKYDVAVYPSSYGADVRSAFDDGNLLLLDPTVNLTDSLDRYYSFDDVNVSGTTLYDMTDNNNDLTLSGSPTTGITGVINEAFSLNESQLEYLYGSRIPLGGSEVSFSFWAKIDDTSEQYIFSQRDLPTNNDFLVRTGSAGDASSAEFLIWGTNPNTYNSATGYFDVGVWTHYAMTFDGTVAKFYKNGSYHSEETLSNTMSNLGSTQFQIGHDDNSGYADIDIDEVAVYTRVLNATEISTLYNDGDGIQYPFAADDSTTVNSISITPSLTATRFDEYLIESNVTNTSAVSVSLSKIIDSSLGGSCFEYYTNGSCISTDPLEANMTFNSTTGLWEYSAFPDTFYPSIGFSPLEDYYTVTGLNDSVYRNRYHVLRFDNNFVIEDNTSFFIEVNADPVSGSTSVPLDVYLVDNTANASFFETDWLSDPSVTLVTSISRDDVKDHSHGSFSSHHLITLLSNGDDLISGLNVSDSFWLVLYSDSVIGRGWNLNYVTSSNTSDWFTASSSPVFTPLSSVSSGVPDVHVHLVRADSDFSNVSVTSQGDGFNDSLSQEFYFSPIGNLAPLTNSFIAPISEELIDVDSIGVYNVSWNPAEDPNGDSVTYDLYLLYSDSILSTFVTNTSNTSYSWNISPSLALDDYALRLVSSDGTLDTTVEVAFSLVNLSATSGDNETAVFTGELSIEDETLSFIVGVVLVGLLISLGFVLPLFWSLAGFGIGGMLLFATSSGVLSHSFVTVLGFAVSVVFVLMGVFKTLESR